MMDLVEKYGVRPESTLVGYLVGKIVWLRQFNLIITFVTDDKEGMMPLRTRS